MKNLYIYTERGYGQGTGVPRIRSVFFATTHVINDLRIPDCFTWRIMYIKLNSTLLLINDLHNMARYVMVINRASALLLPLHPLLLGHHRVQVAMPA